MTQLDLTQPQASIDEPGPFDHLSRDQLERLLVVSLERARIAESRVAAAELRAAKAEADLNTITRAREAAARRRAARAKGQEELTI
jgi:hypothetical protein